MVGTLLAVIAGGVSLLGPLSYDELDSSWALGLTWWFQGRTHGSPIYFTYGPLGWLTETIGWARPEATVSLVFMFALTAALSTLLVTHLRRQLGWIGTVLATFVLLRLLEQRAEMMATISVLAAMLLLRSGRTRDLWLGPAFGAWCGLALLIKPGVGLMCLAVGFLLLAQLGDRLLSAASVVATAAVVVVVVWVVIGQPVGQLVPWLHASEQQMSGYWVMMTEQPGFLWQYPAMVLLGLAFCVAVLRQPDIRWRALALFVPFWYLMLKHGFVRHGDQGSQAVVAVAMCLVTVLPGTRIAGLRHAVLLRIAVAAAVLLSFAVLRAPLHSLNPGTSGVRDLSDAVSTLSSSGRWDRYRRANVASVVASSNLDPALAAQLTGGSQVDPWGVRALWPAVGAWQPVPAFQQYAAYTPWLDQANASAINGTHAPASILRELVPGVDGRFLAYDAPAYQVAVVCHYRVAGETPPWQLLQRSTADRCGRQTTLSTQRVVGGRPMVVPSPQRVGDVVVARFSTRLPLWYRAETLLLKPLHAPVIALDGVPYRLALTTLDDGLLVRLPPAAPSTLGGNDGLTIHTVQLRDAPASGTVTFVEIAYQ